MHHLLIALCFFLCCKATAQQPKQLPAQRTSLPVKIDGYINDSAWKDAAKITDLIEFRPKVGDKEEPWAKTEAYLMYNDEGIFFGGICYEKSKDSIARELTGRDGFGTNDYIGIIFDTYNDKLNGFEYFVTPLNEQWDAKMSPSQGGGNSEDFSWNAVWESGVVIHENGWSFEMFIPYSAIRFPKKEVQTWGLNITRRRRKTEEQFTWNPIEPNANGFLTQEGFWTGITNIKPPLRLQFFPYLSTYINHYPARQVNRSDFTSSLNGGVDVKYGISQAFTLDMTLIPDFGQVQSDNRVLNLTPFEVRYNENRPFFTEGTELFSKGNLFYTRRIGIDPILLHNTREYIQPNELVTKLPVESKLLNATKVSGRTSGGLGIGILNAFTKTRNALLLDTITGKERDVVIDPFTNYSVIVLDQTLRNNSSVSFVNTNVWRSGKEYDANVSAALFNINNKSNSYKIGGKLAMSQLMGYLPNNGNKAGYNYSLQIGKTSGRFKFNLSQELADSKFSSNDLGYFTFNNYLNHYLWFGYNWIQPTSWYNNMYLNINLNYSRQLNPSIYRNANFNVNVNGQLRNLSYIGALVGYEPEFNDFFESRTGKIFRGWSNIFLDAWFQSNQAKKYYFNTELLYVGRSLFDSKRYQVYVSQRYRFNDQFSLTHTINYSPQVRNAGFANHYINGTPTYYFGRRDINTIENVLRFKYNFNEKMYINTRIRHYWSEVAYDQLYNLETDGSLRAVPGDPTSANQNYNIVTVDAGFTWQFAPGSFFNLVWKDLAERFNRNVSYSYFKNFSNTIESEQNNNISLKVIYFLDYLNLKKWF